MAATRLLIVDDHPLIRRGMRELLETQTGASVSEAGSPEEALTHIRSQRWDLVLLDLSMPGDAGMNLLTAIQAERPDLPVLIVSGHPEDQYAVRLLRAGAAGYVWKATPPEVLVRAVRRVTGGGRYISETLAERLAYEMRHPAQPHETLSNREYQVLTLIASGQSSTEIAERLSLSVKTVSTYRSRLLEKLSVRTTAELIRYALEHDLVR
jgi:two-component system invasion response regulator UvrY